MPNREHDTMIVADNHIANKMRQRFALVLMLALFISTADLDAQGRDISAERIVLDDNGADSTLNTVTIRTP